MSINQVLFCFRTHNNLYTPEMVARLGETFAKALDMLEVEKNAILGKGLLFRRNLWADSQRYLRQLSISSSGSEEGLESQLHSIHSSAMI